MALATRVRHPRDTFDCSCIAASVNGRRGYAPDRESGFIGSAFIHSAHESERSAGDVTRMSATDRELVARMGAGDESALGALYDRWSPVVHALACRILADRDEAEDVVEDTFWQ